MTAPPLASSLGSFLDAVDNFFSSLAALDLLSLVVGLSCFCIYISTRSYAYYNVLRAAYPDEAFPFWKIWGAYWAAYGFNNVIPARGGDVMKLFLVRSSIPNSSYPAIGSSFFVEAVFDAVMAVFILTFAFTQGVFPKPPDFSKLQAFDLSYLAVASALRAVPAHRARAWRRWRCSRCSRSACAPSGSACKQGVVILRDRPRYLREVFAVQFVAWVFRFAAFWFLLEAFHVGGSVRNVLLVLGVNAIAAVVPFTRVARACSRRCSCRSSPVRPRRRPSRRYSVGQQIAIGAVQLRGRLLRDHRRLPLPVVPRGHRPGAAVAGARRPRPRRPPGRSRPLGSAPPSGDVRMVGVVSARADRAACRRASPSPA